MNFSKNASFRGVSLFRKNSWSGAVGPALAGVTFFPPMRELVGLGGLEPPTSRLSGVRSNQLSYRPIHINNKLLLPKLIAGLLFN